MVPLLSLPESQGGSCIETIIHSLNHLLHSLCGAFALLWREVLGCQFLVGSQAAMWALNS